MSTRTDRDFIHSLDRGLAVLQAFSRDHPSLTLSEAAALTGLTRATARRVLLTLEGLGFVRCHGRQFSLTPRVLRIGFAYLASLDLCQMAEPVMAALVERTRETCSMSTLDGTDAVYVARVPSKGVTAIAVNVGSRVPAYATSPGRVLLAGLSPGELSAYFREASLRRLTPRTITCEDQLRAELAQVRHQGWALVDQELEEGLRSVAVPIRDRRDRVLASLNLCGHACRLSVEQLQALLPDLQATAKSLV